VPGNCVRYLYSFPRDLVRCSVSNTHQSVRNVSIPTLVYRIIVVIVEEFANRCVGHQGQLLPVRGMKSDTSKE